MAKHRKIAVLVEWSRAYGRGALLGIARYVNAHRTWNVYQTERGLCDGAPGWLRGWDGDGIIARIENYQLLKRIRRAKIPAVDLFEHSRARRIPSVITNNRTVAHLAANHLIERGLVHFAYCGLPGVYSSDVRSDYFVEYLRGKGYNVSVYENRRRAAQSFISIAEDHELRCERKIAAWVDSLPKPVGLMACNDLRAHQVLTVCSDRSIAVPDEVAVIGVDNDQLICELCHPPLTSIEQNPERAGYEAAALLDHMLDGEAPPGEPIVVEPLGVVPRQSTDVEAVNDSHVAAAMQFIRAHACDGIHIGDILKHVPTSRRTLERHFDKLLGCSPKAKIRHTQLEHVKRLLSLTDYPLAKIAHLTGFSYAESIYDCFKRTLGQTPGQYRRASRVKGGIAPNGRSNNPVP